MEHTNHIAAEFCLTNRCLITTAEHKGYLQMSRQIVTEAVDGKHGEEVLEVLAKVFELATFNPARADLLDALETLRKTIANTI